MYTLLYFLLTPPPPFPFQLYTLISVLQAAQFIMVQRYGLKEEIYYKNLQYSKKYIVYVNL